MSLQQNKYIEILGVCGSKTKNCGTTSFKIDNIFIDAGNIINNIDNIYEIEHIFITHPHFDHINDLPYIIESHFEKRIKPLKIYATKETNNFLKKYIFNDIIWPDFNKIKKDNIVLLEYIDLEYNSTVVIEDINIKTIKNNHSIGSCGFTLTYNNSSILITSDTYISNDIIDEINSNNIKAIITEISFPNKLEELAKISKHLTPKLLNEMLKNINKDIDIYIQHIKPLYLEEIKKEINKNFKILNKNDKIFF